MTSTPGNLGYDARTAGSPSAAEPARRSLLGQAIYDTFGQAGARLGAVWIGLLALLGVAAPFLANTHPILFRERGGPLTSPLLRHLGPADVALVVLLADVLLVLAVARRAGAGLLLALVGWPVAALGLVVAAVRYAVPVATLRLYRPGWIEGSGWLAAVLGWVGVVLLHAVVAAGLLLGAWLLVRATRELVTAAAAGPRRAVVPLVSAVLAAILSAAAVFAVRPPENVDYTVYREAERAGHVELAVRTLIPYSPNDRQFDRRQGEPDRALQPPSRRHWFGTTEFSEDMLSRMLHACRVALAIGLIATGIATVIGVAVGGLLGYSAGRLDLLGMRLVEVVESIPPLIVLLIVTVSFGRSLYLMMIVIGLLTWTSDARFVRAEFLRLRKLDFVQAAVAAGLSRASIIFRHMLPNGVAPVLVNASFGIAGAILLESVLSFLGLGLGPEDPSWGQLLEQARKGGTGFNWWIATFPGLAIFLTVFSYILIGEAMRDAVDPRLRKSQG